jgi:hypothetical protein
MRTVKSGRSKVAVANSARLPVGPEKRAWRRSLAISSKPTYGPRRRESAEIQSGMENPHPLHIYASSLTVTQFGRHLDTAAGRS